MVGIWAEDKATIAARWIERTAAAYPPQTARFLIAERDRFRNPVGHALRSALPALFDELAGDMDPARIADALHEVMRIRAVQCFTADEAVGFVYLLKDVLAERRPDLAAALKDAIESVAEIGRDQFARCRQRIEEIRKNEAGRRAYVRERMRVESGP